MTLNFWLWRLVPHEVESGRQLRVQNFEAPTTPKQMSPTLSSGHVRKRERLGPPPETAFPTTLKALNLPDDEEADEGGEVELTACREGVDKLAVRPCHSSSSSKMSEKGLLRLDMMAVKEKGWVEKET
jgi:hypothetical protein